MSNTINNNPNVAQEKECSPLACEVASAILASESNTEALDTYKKCGCDKLVQGTGGALVSALFGAVVGGVTRSKKPAITPGEKIASAREADQKASALQDKGDKKGAQKEWRYAGNDYLWAADFMFRNNDLTDPKVAIIFESAVHNARRCFDILGDNDSLHKTLNLMFDHYEKIGNVEKQVDVLFLMAETFKKGMTRTTGYAEVINTLKKVVSVAEDIKVSRQRNAIQAVAWEDISVIHEKYNFHLQAAEALLQSAELSVRNADFASALPKLNEILKIFNGGPGWEDVDSIAITHMKGSVELLAATVANPFPDIEQEPLSDADVEELKVRITAKLKECEDLRRDSSPERQLAAGLADIEAAIMQARLDASGERPEHDALELLLDAQVIFNQDHPLYDMSVDLEAAYLWNRRPTTDDYRWGWLHLVLIDHYTSKSNWKKAGELSERVLAWERTTKVTDPSLMLELLPKVFDVRQKLGDEKGAVDALFELAELQIKAENLVAAQDFSNKITVLVKNGTSDWEKAAADKAKALGTKITGLIEAQNHYMATAKTLIRSSQWNEALSNIKSAFDLFKRRGAEVQKGEAYMLMGFVQTQLGMDRSAIASYEKARVSFSEGKDHVKAGQAGEKIMDANLELFQRGRNRFFMGAALKAYNLMVRDYGLVEPRMECDGFAAAERLADAITPFITRGYGVLVPELYQMLGYRYNELERHSDAGRNWGKFGELMMAGNHYHEAVGAFGVAEAQFARVGELNAASEMATAKKAAYAVWLDAGQPPPSWNPTERTPERTVMLEGLMEKEMMQGEEPGVMRAGKAEKTNKISPRLLVNAIGGGKEAMQALMRAVRDREPDATEMEVATALSSKNPTARRRLGLDGLDSRARKALSDSIVAITERGKTAKDRAEKGRKGGKR